MRHYRQEHFAEAEGAATRVIGREGTRPGAAEAFYIRGCARMHLHRAVEAQADFQRAVELSKRRDLTARARAALGSLAADNRRYEEACDQFAAAVDELPARPPLDEILYRYGLSLQRVGRWREARRVLGQIIRKFRGRPVEEPARRLFSWPDDFFSIQCGAFGRRSNAEKLVGRLRDAGWDATVRTEIRAGQGVYLVRVGRYQTYAQARAELARAQDVQPGAFVVP